MSTLKVLRRENTGVVYADPTDPDLIVRFKNGQSSKTLNGVSVTNHTTEIIYNDDNSITVAGVGAVDALSVRLRVSGSNHSAARILTLLTAMAAQVETWHTEGVFAGFEPATAPVIPAP